MAGASVSFLISKFQIINYNLILIGRYLLRDTLKKACFGKYKLFVAIDTALSEDVRLLM
jgi:hypothetical protein